MAIHHITGGDELDQKRDGDFADHDRRYARTAEFMGLLRRELTATEPFDHDGEFYRVRGAYSYVKPASADAIPLYFGGASPAAISVGARHADVYMLWGEPVAQIAERVAGIRAEAALARPHRPVQPVGPADRGPDRGGGVAARRGDPRGHRDAGHRNRGTPVRGTQVQGIQVPDSPGPARRLFGFRESSSVGSERLQQQAAERECFDDRLWYGVTRLTGPGGNSTALVGTAAQVADALMAYRRVGVDTVLIRGFDPLDDVVEWGRELVPLLREEAARPGGRAGRG